MKKHKIIICPDSFKGVMSSKEASSIISKAIKDTLLDIEIVELPIADGGEGTIDCFKHGVAGEDIFVNVLDSNFKKINAKYYLTSSEAVIESAEAIGLYLTKIKNPELTSSYGVGQLIKDALKYTNKIVLALGGSSTNDGGCGIASALGAKFYNKKGESFIPTGWTLNEIEKIDITKLPKPDMLCMCDIKNIMHGQSGASYVYSPQKGADCEMVKRLDNGLMHLSNKIKECLNKDVSKIEGGGAAGAIGAGMVAFFDAKLKSGINIMLDLVNFEEKLKSVSLVITGEGKLDSQSFSGKVIDGIIQRASDFNVPVMAISGSIENGLDWQKHGLKYAFNTGKPNIPFEKAKLSAKSDLYKTVVSIFKNNNILKTKAK